MSSEAARFPAALRSAVEVRESDQCVPEAHIGPRLHSSFSNSDIVVRSPLAMI